MVDISVIVPVFNEPDGALRSIQSVVQCLDGHCLFEIVVVDDGSDYPFSEFFYRECGVKDNVKLIRQENAGVSSARNLGISRSIGELISFLDSGDLMLPDFGSQFIKEIRDNPGYDFYTSGFKINGLNVGVGDDFSPCFLGFLRNQYFCTNSIIVRSRVLLMERFREGYHFGEDVDLWLRLLKRYHYLHFPLIVSHYIFQPKVHRSKRHPFLEVSLFDLDLGDDEISCIRARFDKRLKLISAIDRDESILVFIKRLDFFLIYYWLFGEAGYKVLWWLRHCFRIVKQRFSLTF
jgi:glycosyltransferase involved in cell wall biosynthesis